MTPERWLRLEELFDKTVEMDPDERRAYLDKVCAEDTTMRRQVESLIISGQEAGSFIEAAIHDAAEVVAESDALHIAEDRIGSYKLEKEIGRGGMGAVYLATRDDDEYQKQVAIKLVRAGLGSSEMLRRFRSERQILANLDHPNIARLLDGGTTDAGAPFVVMEYVEGEPIDHYCDRNRLTTTERLKLFRKVCSAVEYAHKNLVIHRDIKPGNILVTADGEPKLLDFGIAKFLKTDQLLQTAVETQAGVRMMTPEYASPEQVRGEAITTASDVYTLGIVLYELLTGHRPYQFKNYLPQEIERVICEQEPEKPSTAITRELEIAETDGDTSKKVTADVISRRRASTSEKLRRQLSGDLDNIVLMAMRKEPERRYSSVEQLSEDISRHMEGLPVIARGDTLGYRAQKFIGRHRAGVMAAAAAILLIAALIGFYTTRLASERDRAQLEAAKAAQVSEFLTGLFDVSDPGQSKGESITARELLDRGTTKIRSELARQPEVQAAMLNVLGRVHRTLGLYKEAESLLEESLRIRRQQLGNENLEVADTLFNLGELLHYEQKYDEAKPYYEEALAIRRKISGEKNLDVAKSIDLLGRLVRDKGDLDTAERLHREAFAIRQNLLPENHADIADSLHSFGILFRLKGNYKEAEAYFRRELAITQSLGKEYPALLHNLAEALESQGKYEEAESFSRQTLALSRKLYGDQHPFVANSLEGLGLLLHRKGDSDAAEPLVREALAMRRKMLGDETPAYALSMNNLARVLTAKGGYDEAEALYRQALALFRKLLGEEASRVADAMNNLALMFYDKGDYEAAEKLSRETLALDRKLMGEDHPYVAQDMYSLARVLRERGNNKEAESLFRQALDMQRKKLGEGHPEIASTLIGLGSVLNREGDAQGAEVLLREALEIRRKALPEGRWEIAVAESELGDCLTLLRRYDEAEKLLTGSYPVIKAKQGERHKRTRRALSHLIKLYKVWGKPAKAAEYTAMLEN